jgi:hypothetical protein
VFISADHVENFVFSRLIPVADEPEMRNALRAAESGDADEARQLVLESAVDESGLVSLESDYYQAHIIDRATFIRQSSALRKKIEDRTHRLSSLRGQSALDRLGGQVADHWQTMSADDKRLITLSVVSDIQVSRSTRRGSNVFDDTRVCIVWRLSEQAMQVIGDAVREIESQMVDGMLA